jgi:hypothetical protein
MPSLCLKPKVNAVRGLLLACLVLLGASAAARDALVVTPGPGADLVRAFELARLAQRPEAASPAAYEIFVSPLGNDAWSGRRQVSGGDGPLLSLPAAQRKARALGQLIAQGGQAAKPVHVILLPGSYRLSQPLMFDERDSGRPGQPVVYRAEQAGTVRVSGGVELSWQRTTEGIAQFDLPPASSADWRRALQLFVNGRRATLARMPDAGKYWFVQPPDPAHRDRLRVDAVAARWLGDLSPQDRAGLVVNLYQAWTTTRHYLDTTSTADLLALAPAPRWPFLNFGRSQRFYVENVAAAMDAPGEWFGEAKAVRYRVRPDEQGQPPVAVLPLLPRLIGIASSKLDAAPVQDLEFRDIDFEHAVFLTPAAGFVDNQAASSAGAAIEVDQARRIVFDHCSFRHVGAHAIWLRRDVRESTLSSNLFEDLGAGAIRVGVNHQPDPKLAVTGDNHIRSNVITGTGAVLPGGAGIWLGQTWDNEVSNNLVANTTYTGISVGWTWGFGSPTSGRNLIARNLLVNIGQGELADLGGIYTLGESPGTVVRGNVVREVRSYPEYGPGGGKGATGIYQDEGTSDTLVERNLVVGTDSGGYQLHFGRNNLVRQNLFAMGDEAEFRVVKVKSEGPSVIATGNLLISPSATPFFGLASPPNVSFKDDVVSAPTNAMAGTRTRCGDGCRFETVTLSAGRDAKDIQLRGLSESATQAWRQVVNEAGPMFPELVKTVVVRSPVEQAAPPVAPTLAVHIDIANAAVGSQPAGLSYRPLDDPQAIRIEQGQGGRGAAACLGFQDASSYKNRFEPFAFATLGHTQGTWSARFKLWVDDRAEFIHEWRDAATPFMAGPSLVVTQGQVRVNGQVIAAIRPGAWTEFKVTAALGARARDWTLEITDDAGRARRFTGLPLKHPGWTELRWVGFVSNAADTTFSCVGSIDIAASAP